MAAVQPRTPAAPFAICRLVIRAAMLPAAAESSSRGGFTWRIPPGAGFNSLSTPQVDKARQPPVTERSSDRRRMGVVAQAMAGAYVASAKPIGWSGVAAYLIALPNVTLEKLLSYRNETGCCGGFVTGSPDVEEGLRHVSESCPMSFVQTKSTRVLQEIRTR